MYMLVSLESVTSFIIQSLVCFFLRGTESVFTGITFSPVTAQVTISAFRNLSCIPFIGNGFALRPAFLDSNFGSI